MPGKAMLKRGGRISLTRTSLIIPDDINLLHSRYALMLSAWADDRTLGVD